MDTMRQQLAASRAPRESAVCSKLLFQNPLQSTLASREAAPSAMLILRLVHIVFSL